MSGGSIFNEANVIYNEIMLQCKVDYKKLGNTGGRMGIPKSQNVSRSSYNQEESFIKILENYISTTNESERLDNNMVTEDIYDRLINESKDSISFDTQTNIGIQFRRQDSDKGDAYPLWFTRIGIELMNKYHPGTFPEGCSNLVHITKLEQLCLIVFKKGVGSISEEQFKSMFNNDLFSTEALHEMGLASINELYNIQSLPTALLVWGPSLYSRYMSNDLLQNMRYGIYQQILLAQRTYSGLAIKLVNIVISYMLLQVTIRSNFRCKSVDPIKECIDSVIEYSRKGYKGVIGKATKKKLYKTKPNFTSTGFLYCYNLQNKVFDEIDNNDELIPFIESKEGVIFCKNVISLNDYDVCAVLLMYAKSIYAFSKNKYTQGSDVVLYNIALKTCVYDFVKSKKLIKVIARRTRNSVNIDIPILYDIDTLQPIRSNTSTGIFIKYIEGKALLTDKECEIRIVRSSNYVQTYLNEGEYEKDNLLLEAEIPSLLRYITNIEMNVHDMRSLLPFFDLTTTERFGNTGLIGSVVRLPSPSQFIDTNNKLPLGALYSINDTCKQLQHTLHLPSTISEAMYYSSKPLMNNSSSGGTGVVFTLGKSQTKAAGHHFSTKTVISSNGKRWTLLYAYTYLMRLENFLVGGDATKPFYTSDRQTSLKESRVIYVLALIFQILLVFVQKALHSILFHEVCVPVSYKDEDGNQVLLEGEKCTPADTMFTLYNQYGSTAEIHTRGMLASGCSFDSCKLSKANQVLVSKGQKPIYMPDQRISAVMTSDYKKQDAHMLRVVVAVLENLNTISLNYNSLDFSATEIEGFWKMQVNCDLVKEVAALKTIIKGNTGIINVWVNPYRLAYISFAKASFAVYEARADNPSTSFKTNGKMEVLGRDFSFGSEPIKYLINVAMNCSGAYTTTDINNLGNSRVLTPFYKVADSIGGAGDDAYIDVYKQRVNTLKFLRNMLKESAKELFLESDSNLTQFCDYLKKLSFGLYCIKRAQKFNVEVRGESTVLNWKESLVAEYMFYETRGCDISFRDIISYISLSLVNSGAGYKLYYPISYVFQSKEHTPLPFVSMPVSMYYKADHPELYRFTKFNVPDINEQQLKDSISSFIYGVDNSSDNNIKVYDKMERRKILLADYSGVQGTKAMDNNIRHLISPDVLGAYDAASHIVKDSLPKRISGINAIIEPSVSILSSEMRKFGRYPGAETATLGKLREVPFSSFAHDLTFTIIGECTVLETATGFTVFKEYTQVGSGSSQPKVCKTYTHYNSFYIQYPLFTQVLFAVFGLSTERPLDIQNILPVGKQSTNDILLSALNSDFSAATLSNWMMLDERNAKKFADIHTKVDLIRDIKLILDLQQQGFRMSDALLDLALDTLYQFVQCKTNELSHYRQKAMAEILLHYTASDMALKFNPLSHLNKFNIYSVH